MVETKTEKMAIFITDNNMQGVLCASLLQPNSILIIRQEDDNEDLIKPVTDILLSVCNNAEINVKTVNLSKLPDTYLWLCQELSGCTAVTMLPEGSVLGYSLAMAAQSCGAKMVYFDTVRDILVTIDKDKLIETPALVEMNLKQLLASSEPGVEKSETELYKETFVVDILSYIKSNYSQWIKGMKVLKCNSLLLNELNPLNISIKINKFEYSDYSAFMDIMHYLEKRGLINKLSKVEDIVSLRFRDAQVQRFLMKTGSWLEALVYYIVKEIKEVDDTQSGVVFYWTPQTMQLVNEIDVVAVVDSRIVCISCKDSENQDTAYLNELDVYAEKIGGAEVVKIIIFSTKPKSKGFLIRAKEMGIHVLYFDGNTETLKSIIRSHF